MNGPYWRQINIGSGNDLVPWSNVWLYHTSIPVEKLYLDETVVEWKPLKSQTHPEMMPIMKTQYLHLRLLNRFCFSLVGPEPLLWRHNERGCVSNHRHLNCLLSRLLRRRSKETPKLRVTGLCDGNYPVAGEFPTQKASNVERFSIWWRQHDVHK